MYAFFSFLRFPAALRFARRTPKTSHVTVVVVNKWFRENDDWPEHGRGALGLIKVSFPDRILSIPISSCVFFGPIFKLSKFRLLTCSLVSGTHENSRSVPFTKGMRLSTVLKSSRMTMTFIFMKITTLRYVDMTCTLRHRGEGQNVICYSCSLHPKCRVHQGQNVTRMAGFICQNAKCEGPQGSLLCFQVVWAQVRLRNFLCCVARRSMCVMNKCAECAKASRTGMHVQHMMWSHWCNGLKSTVLAWELGGGGRPRQHEQDSVRPPPGSVPENIILFPFVLDLGISNASTSTEVCSEPKLTFPTLKR